VARSSRSGLAHKIGEGLFWQTCLGDSITDRVFFEQEPGTVAGPWKTRFGYALVYVVERDFPAPPREPVENELFEDFVPFLRETFERTEVSGLEAGTR
jgi:hypothetical protein